MKHRAVCEIPLMEYMNRREPIKEGAILESRRHKGSEAIYDENGTRICDVKSPMGRELFEPIEEQQETAKEKELKGEIAKRIEDVTKRIGGIAAGLESANKHPWQTEAFLRQIAVVRRIIDEMWWLTSDLKYETEVRCYGPGWEERDEVDKDGDD